MQSWLDELKGSFPNDLFGFAPELILCIGIILMLVIRLFKPLDRLHLGSVALCITITALVIAVGQWISIRPVDSSAGVANMSAKRHFDMFTGLLAYDNLTVYLRLFLFTFTVLVIWLSLLTRIPDREDSGDFYCLLLGATLGMSLMASANHLLMVFIGVEMASLPSYALAGFLKGRRRSSEAALKYVVYGGGASGIMLYGISLLVGKFGTGYLPDLAIGYAGALASPGQLGNFDAIVVLGTLFIIIGIAFKLAAVPFHFWCPDVFEGAAAEVAAFLSVASKGAALALLARFGYTIATLAAPVPDYNTWLKVAQYLVPIIAFLAVLTTTFGNLAAYRQTNLKRLLAYSTIAHAGYMMMGLATFTQIGLSAVLFYLAAYLFMNLGAFAVVAFVRNITGSEELSAYRGLMQRAPVLAVAMGFFMFSLLGVPPLAGFAAKFQIFRALYDSASFYTDRAPALSYIMYALLGIGGLNTVLSLVYYINVLRVMVLEQPDNNAEATPLRVPLASGFYASLMAVAVLVLGILWDPVADISAPGADNFYMRRPELTKAASPGGQHINRRGTK